MRRRAPTSGEARFTLAAAKATCDEEGTGDAFEPFSRSKRWWMAVKGGLSGPGEWWVELLLTPLVDWRGVAGAVSGNSGGVTFIGRGNKDARGFFRPNPKRPDPVFLEECCGFGVLSNETWRGTDGLARRYPAADEWL